MKRAAIALIALVGCQQKASPRLVSDDELAAYEHDLARRIAANEKQHCSPDIVAAIDGPTLPIAAFEKIVAAHTRGCSPFQIGVRPEPRTTQRALRAMNLLEDRIVALGATDPVRAVTLGGQTMQLYQDFGRGHVPGWVAPSASAVMVSVVEKLEPIVAKLSPDQAAAFGATLDQLIANVPPYADALEGEREEMESRPRGGGRFDDPRDEAGVAFVFGEAWAKAAAKDCPATATLATCERQLEPSGPKPPILDYKMVGPRLHRGEDPAILRAELIAQLPNKRAYLEVASAAASIANGVARMAALRIHIEIVRQGRCPTEAELETPPYSILRRPAVLGDALHLQRPPGRLDLWPPEWANRSTPWSIPCPGG